MHNEFTAIIVV